MKLLLLHRLQQLFQIVTKKGSFMLRTQYYGKDIRDQNGQQVIARLIQFAVHKSERCGLSN